jgi:hypothetical protein
MLSAEYVTRPDVAIRSQGRALIQCGWWVSWISNCWFTANEYSSLGRLLWTSYLPLFAFWCFQPWIQPVWGILRLIFLKPQSESVFCFSFSQLLMFRWSVYRSEECKVQDFREKREISLVLTVSWVWVFSVGQWDIPSPLELRLPRRSPEISLKGCDLRNVGTSSSTEKLPREIVLFTSAPWDLSSARVNKQGLFRMKHLLFIQMFSGKRGNLHACKPTGQSMSPWWAFFQF